MNNTHQKSFDRANMFGTGQRNGAFTEDFIGQSYLQNPNEPTEEVPVGLAIVTFEPRCRNN